MRVIECPQVSLFDNAPAWIHGRHIGPDHPDVGMRAKHPHLRFELPREKRVVRVEQRDELAPGVGESKIPGRRNATIRLAQVADRRPAPVALDHPPRLVGRAVVDDDDFHVVVSLPEHALDGRADDTGAIMRRDDHADHPRLPASFEVAVRTRSESRP